MNNILQCGYIYENEPDLESDSYKAGIGKQCPNVADWIVSNNNDRYDYVYSCGIHIADMFEDKGKPNLFWPIGWGTP